MALQASDKLKTMFVLLGALSLPGCLAIDIDTLPLCNDSLWLESTLYLGRTVNMKPVSDEDWQAFVEQDVTPRFPDGFTYLDGRGAWYNKTFGRTIFENSTLLIILHPNTHEDRTKVNEVAQFYRTKFNQQAVLRSRQNVCVKFITE